MHPTTSENGSSTQEYQFQSYYNAFEPTIWKSKVLWIYAIDYPLFSGFYRDPKYGLPVYNRKSPSRSSFPYIIPPAFLITQKGSPLFH